VTGFAAGTFTRGRSIDDEDLDANGFSYNLSTSLRKRSHGFSFAYTQVGEDFNPEAGFLERTSFRKINGGINGVMREHMPFEWLRELGPHVTWRRYMDIDGFFESETLHLDVSVDADNGAHFSPAVDIIYEGVRTPFEVYPEVLIPPGSYRHPVLAWRFNSNLSAPFSVNLALDAGGFYNGRLNSYRAGFTWRYSSQFNVSVNHTRNVGRFPITGPNREFGGSFNGDLFFLRANYSFTPRVYVQSLLQYNDAGDNWAVNLRFGWLNTAGTGLFLVYNETQDLIGVDNVFRRGVQFGGPVNRAVFLKFTREFRIFE
jgi:hypothetical protein